MLTNSRDWIGCPIFMRNAYISIYEKHTTGTTVKWQKYLGVNLGISAVVWG
jgi:hypothetical protein